MGDQSIGEDITSLRLPYTVKEYARMWRLSQNAVYEGVRRGEIPAVRMGRAIRIPRDAGDRKLSGGDA